jgi:hypothetical protein
MSPRFLKRSYGGKVFLTLFALSMEIESNPKRRASAMVVPPLFKKFEDMFLGLSIRSVICLL